METIQEPAGVDQTAEKVACKSAVYTECRSNHMQKMTSSRTTHCDYILSTKCATKVKRGVWRVQSHPQ
eukprot:5108733-Amphidinium_carterae.1